MGGQAVAPHGWLQYAIPFVVLAVVFAVRWRRMSQDRPLKLERLWVVPALYTALAVAVFATNPPPPRIWAFSAVALVLGAGVGWMRGRSMRITVDPETHRLNHRASPAALVFLAVLILLRQAMRDPAVDLALDMDALAVADIAIALGVGLFAAQRLEMWLRGRRLLAEVRGR